MALATCLVTEINKTRRGVVKDYEQVHTERSSYRIEIKEVDKRENIQILFL